MTMQWIILGMLVSMAFCIGMLSNRVDRLQKEVDELRRYS